MRSRSKSSEFTAELSLDKSLKRFLLLPLERSRREARRLCNAERRSRATFWTSVCWSEEHAARSCADPTFEVELAERVECAWNSPVCADRIERSAEGIKAVPDGIILNDL